MITTNDDVIVLLDSIEIFSGPTLVSFPYYNPETEYCNVEVSIRNDDGNHIRYATFELSKIDLDAASLSAATTTDKWMEAVEKVLKEKLESLNPSATFTIT